MDKKFDIGEKVVHPHHGVGFISGLEEKKFDPNSARPYYVVSISDITLWVPVNNRSTTKLRKLSTKSEIEQCVQVLKSTPSKLTPGRDMLSNLSAHIKQGTIIAQCEVVRDLTAYANKKPLFGTLSEFLNSTLAVLCQEWAAVKDISIIEATGEINGLLKNGKVPQKPDQPKANNESTPVVE